MSWENIIKRNCGCGKDVCEKYGAAPTMEKLSPKQKKLDRNHNGVIDAQDFHIMGGSDEKKSCSKCNEKMEMEKLAFGAKVQCPDCGAMFPNNNAHSKHHQEKHSGSNKRSAFTR
jgi:hypothetical protein